MSDDRKPWKCSECYSAGILQEPSTGEDFILYKRVKDIFLGCSAIKIDKNTPNWCSKNNGEEF